MFCFDTVVALFAALLFLTAQVTSLQELLTEVWASGKWSEAVVRIIVKEATSQGSFQTED